MTIPVYIVNRNWLSCTKRLVEWLLNAGTEQITILDNASTYEPLLDWYEQLPTEVVVRKIGHNAGQYIFWDLKLYEEFDSPYVMTDPDTIPSDCCPLDLIQHLNALLTAHPEWLKVGPGIRTDNLPDSFPYKERVIREQHPYWERRLTAGVFAAPIDTTFALYGRKSPGANSSSGARTDFPYVVEHTPWYIWPLTEEAKYYGQHCEQHVLASVSRYWKELGAIEGERYW